MLLVFGLKFVLFIADPLPKYYLGDSSSYIFTALSGWIPKDRSYFYGFVIRWLALSAASLTPLLIVQLCLGAIVSILAARICLMFFRLPLWGSFVIGLFCCLDPLQLFWERAIMTETISLFFYALLLYKSFVYLKKPRLLDLVWIQIISILLIGFRMSYLALVTSLAVALPLLAFAPLSLKVWMPLLAVTRQTPAALAGKLRVPVGHFVVSVGAMLALHHIYKTANGALSHRQPNYLYGTGFHLLSFWAPVVESKDAADARLADLIQHGGEFHIKDRSARLRQRFSAGFLIKRWCDLEPDLNKANEIAKQTAFRAFRRHPGQVALLAWQTYLDHWRPGAIIRYASVDLKMGSFKESEVRELAERFHQAITSPKLANEPSTLTKRYYVAAYPYYFVVLLLPLISIAATVMPGIRKRYACSLFLQSMVHFVSTFVLTATPVVRYLQPLSLLTLLNLAALVKVAAVRRNYRDKQLNYLAE